MKAEQFHANPRTSYSSSNGFFECEAELGSPRRNYRTNLMGPVGVRDELGIMAVEESRISPWTLLNREDMSRRQFTVQEMLEWLSSGPSSPDFSQ